MAYDCEKNGLYFIRGYTEIDVNKWLEDAKKGIRHGSAPYGFHTSLDRAKEIVEKNITDLHEGIYNYVTIEHLFPNAIYPFAKETLYYKWDGEKYVQIPEHPEYHGG